MDNPMAAQVYYGEYRRQADWVNANGWQFEKVVKRHSVRTTVVKALIALAHAVMPATERETGTA